MVSEKLRTANEKPKGADSFAPHSAKSLESSCLRRSLGPWDVVEMVRGAGPPSLTSQDRGEKRGSRTRLTPARRGVRCLVGGLAHGTLSHPLGAKHKLDPLR